MDIFCPMNALSRLRRCPWLATVSVMVALLTPSAACAGTANAGLGGAGSDPIAGMTWGYYTGNDDEIWPTYEAATGNAKQLLGEVALRPEANWFGPWEQPSAIQGDVSGYVSDVTHGNPAVLSQLTDFSLSPWEGQICTTPVTPALVSAYHAWNDGFAAGIGDSRALVVMQPDLPEANNKCLSSQARATLLGEVAWATRKLDSLAHTTVYLDAGSSDWESVPVVTSLLIQSGIRSARGFALDATHYASTQSEISYGTQVVEALARRGLKHKHFIIDTAENGSPFDYHALIAAGAAGSNVAGCTSIDHPSLCQTFGIPPTYQVASPQWKLGAHDSALATKYVDGYVWFGRPWLYAQSGQFDCQLVEQMAQSTPFPYPDGASSSQPSPNALRRTGVSSHGRASAATALPPDPYCPASSLS